MCGICGIVGREGRSGVDRVEAMARTLDHRGPDDRGVWQGRFRDRGVDCEVAFGHTRLAVIDLSPLGHQPMSSSDGALTVTYNGEIYNFRELRDELRALGHVFRSECDTEVLLAAYRAWGVACLERLSGMFAFALWDAQHQRLFLARDRIGKKPLYWSHADGLFLFASELRALRAHPGFRPEIDRNALARFLQNGYVTGPETIYAQVRRLMPGHYLVLEAGEVQETAYWNLADCDREMPSSFEDAVDELERRLGDAVEQRLVADVPLGAFLSGGIDSTAVTSLMCERARGRVRTFSIGFGDRAYDEAPHARAVAEHLGTAHTEFYVRSEDARGVARELPDLYDEPFADSSAIPTVLLSRLTRGHVTVALSGDGGDELLGGYAHYRKLRRLAPWLAAPRALRRLLASAGALSPSPSLARGLGHLDARDPCELAQRLVRHFSPEVIRDLCQGSDDRQTYRDAFEAAGVEDPVRRAMFADAATYLPDDILTKVDRATMSIALEARVPLLDHRVVRLALSLPLDWVWHRGRTKAPLREIVYRRVPRAIMERRKHGFGIPIQTLLAEELSGWTERYLSSARLAEEGNLDPAAVARLLRGIDPSTAFGAARLWFLICFQRWFARVHRGESLG